MNSFSASSRTRLNTCHPDLIKLFETVLQRRDCAILCGYRGEHEQNIAKTNGKSKCSWPNSMHNKFPSLAVDAGPSPVHYDDKQSFVAFSSIVLETAKELGVEIHWGGDFKDLGDLDHFELVIK